MSRPRVDVVVLTMNDRPAEEAAAQATLRAQSGVDVRVVVVGNGCTPEVVPPDALTVSLPGNVGIPGGRNAGAHALHEAGDPAEWLYFLDNDAGFPRADVLARLVAEAERHPEAAWVQPRLTGPDDAATPRRWVPRLRASNPGQPGKVASMTEGVVLIRRDAFDAVGGWEERLFLYHEGVDLAWRLYEAGWGGWYAASIRMHHPLTEPARPPRAVPPARSPQPDLDRPPQPPRPAPSPPPERLDHNHPGPGRAPRRTEPDPARHARRMDKPAYAAAAPDELAHRPPTHRRRAAADHLTLRPIRPYEESSSPCTNRRCPR
ncbi:MULTISPECIES: glycosyltransferase family 2 protein [unclassified Streptomyces]|uniref:glycosyltransferase family 2 protein n=1 Tax=Streptomyces TaxID=1883 RepID=UPI0026C931DC|nr:MULTISPECIES: glycosyltransferase family 2 protein [unclassified Streptomyces]